MSKLSIRLKGEELRSFDSASMTGSLQLVDSAFSNPIILLKIVNESSQGITVSFDGVTNVDYLPANSGQIYDVNTNRYRDNGGMQIQVGDGVWVTGTAGTGTIYVAAFYAG